MSEIINKIVRSHIAHQIFDYGLVTVAVLLVLLPVSPLNFQLSFKDPGVFLYTGWRILHGEVPYRDVWDQKPPVIFYLNALGLAVAGGSRWGVWAIELISLFVAALIGYKIIQRLLGKTAAVYCLPPDASPDQYAALILSTFGSSAYRELALSAFADYQDRLNWTSAGAHVASLLRQV